jgi:hypothetical protein
MFSGKINIIFIVIRIFRIRIILSGCFPLVHQLISLFLLLPCSFNTAQLVSNLLNIHFFISFDFVSWSRAPWLVIRQLIPQVLDTGVDILPLEHSKNMEGYKGKYQNLEGNERMCSFFRNCWILKMFS